MMEEQVVEATIVEPLPERWEAVRAVRSQIAVELQQMAAQMPGTARKQLRILSRWFQGEAQLEDALRRPDVLAISLPLLNRVGDPVSANGPVVEGSLFTASEIAGATRQGFCALGRYPTLSRRFFRLLLYPLLVVMVLLLLTIGFSFYLAPEFASMYEDFGIQLPRMTLFVFEAAEWIRTWWPVLLVWPLVLLFLFWHLSGLKSGPRPANLSWMDQRLMGTRNTLAAWAWHFSLLLEAGVSDSKSLTTAGQSAGKDWLEQISFAWVERETIPGHPLGTEVEVSADGSFLSRRFQLLNFAVSQPPSNAKIVLLREVANYYWDRNRSIGDWWIHWLTYFMFFCVALLVAVVVISLFLPMLAIIGGLTGGGLW